MNIYSLLILSFIPVIAFFAIFCICVKGFKVRWGLLSCFLGILTVIPASFVQYYILNLPVFYKDTLVNLLITTVIFNGLIEETFKMLFLSVIPVKNKTLKHFFICAVLFGLTLGSIESVIYLIKKLGESLFPLGTKELLKLIFSRMFTSVLIHIFCAALSSIYLWLFKHKKTKIMPFVWAVLLHGIYNFFAGFTGGFYWFSIIAILFCILESRIWYKNAKEMTCNEISDNQ